MAVPGNQAWGPLGRAPPPHTHTHTAPRPGSTGAPQLHACAMRPGACPSLGRAEPLPQEWPSGLSVSRVRPMTHREDVGTEGRCRGSGLWADMAGALGMGAGVPGEEGPARRELSHLPLGRHLQSQGLWVRRPCPVPPGPSPGAQAWPGPVRSRPLGQGFQGPGPSLATAPPNGPAEEPGGAGGPGGSAWALAGPGRGRGLRAWLAGSRAR